MNETRGSASKVSIVCAWYNRADYIRDTVDSLLAQNFANFEVVIINDGSTDPHVRQTLDSYHDPRLRVIHQNNTGFTVAIRRAIESVSGEFIAIQGAGDISYSERLFRQFHFLNEHPDFAAVGCSRDTEIIGGTLNGEIRNGKHYKKQRWSRHDLMSPIIPFGHGDTMFRASVYHKSGGYRTFFRYAQDRDLWPRMSEFGDFFIMNETLYCRRAFVDEGVGIHPTKQILQRKYMSFALQCAIDREAYGFDSVDVFGDGAGVFARAGSRFVATVMAKKALKHLLHNNDHSANFVATLAWHEKRTIFVACAVVLIRLALWSSKLKWIALSILRMIDYDRAQKFEPIR